MILYNTLQKIKRFIFSKKDINTTSVRKIEKVNTGGKRIVAMTFDDGPCAVVCPDGRKLTEFIVDTLNEYSFTATFNIIGSTAENYPDNPGRSGSFYWSGTRYDHYPRFGDDILASAVNNPDLIRKIIDSGCELANHGYRHIVCGKQHFPYSKRVYFKNENEVYADYLRLHNYILESFRYPMTNARPPHYVESIGRGDPCGRLSSYSRPSNKTVFDVYEKLGYNYLSASFDGGGWEKNSNADEMVARLKRQLESNADSFCGSIIYQKDGLNMSGEMPIYEALPRQLNLLKSFGCSVVSVRELLEEEKL
ncbi:MAG: hypothetical protein A2Y17_11825 [Clostridiales bacterium GWF2_38_85]|nr:MAG: hypothetical protein A2Y17_11825 [Clostridiales bacterium GWF2_38_85]HBL85390.1 hypothetical protein [Clostridiales bacterium]